MRLTDKFKKLKEFLWDHIVNIIFITIVIALIIQKTITTGHKRLILPNDDLMRFPSGAIRNIEMPIDEKYKDRQRP